MLPALAAWYGPARYQGAINDRRASGIAWRCNADKTMVRRSIYLLNWVARFMPLSWLSTLLIGAGIAVLRLRLGHFTAGVALSVLH